MDRRRFRFIAWCERVFTSVGFLLVVLLWYLLLDLPEGLRRWWKYHVQTWMQDVAWALSAVVVASVIAGLLVAVAIVGMLLWL